MSEPARPGPSRPPVPVGVDVRRIARAACGAWEERDGAYTHRSGRFFRVIGVRTGIEERAMIDQPEIGVLAFLLAEVEGAPSVLVQWKSEPGNRGVVQAAPTVQATRSNIDRVHGGRPTALLAEVLAPEGRIADVVGSEQGDRFLAKANRDLMRRLDAPLEVGPGAGLPGHEWVGRDRLIELLRSDHLLNTDARSVLASAPWEPWLRDAGRPFAPLAELLDVPPSSVATSWRTTAARRRDDALALLRRHGRDRPTASVVPLGDLRTFRIEDDGVVAGDGSRVLGWFAVTLPDREVPRWCQPLLEQADVGRCVLVFAERDGTIRLGLRVSIEPGWTRAEFGPTLQRGHDDALLDRFAGDPSLEVVATIEQTDEGGRFFDARARYELARWHGEPAALGDDVAWLTLGEVEALARRGRTTTNELRSCLSLVLAHG